MKILVVDDNIENNKMMMIMLKNKNYDVKSAINGKEALKKLYSKRYDLIISDILMPVMDGFQLCRECKKDVKLKNICFIFYTETFTEEKDEEFALSLGAQKFIRKPQEPEVFLNLIEELIEKSRNGGISQIDFSKQGEKEALKLYDEHLITKLEKRNLELENEIISHKVSANTIKESEKRFRSLIKQSSEGAILADIKGIIIECNKAVESITGLNTEQIIGTPFWELQLKLQPPDSNSRPKIESFKDIFHEVIRTGKSDYFYKPFSVNFLSSKGEYKTILQSVFPVKTNRGYYLGALINDITELTKAEEILQENERRLTSIYNTVGDIIFHLAVEADGSYRFMSVNRAFCSLTGFSEDLVVGKLVNQVIPEPSLSMVLKKYKQAIEEKSIIRWEEISEYPAGQLIGDVSIAPLFNENGHCTQLVGSVHDITQHKRMEEELKFRNIILSTQQEASIDGILVVNEDGEIISSNKRFADMWDISCKIIESKSFERTLQIIMDNVAKPDDFRNKVKYLYKARNETSRDEILLKDGRIFDRYSAPMLDAGGKYFGRVWYFRDITERKRAEEALFESEVKYRTLVMNSPDGIFIMDVSGSFISVNKTMLDNLKYTEEELLSMKLWDIVPAQYLSLHRNRMKVIMAGEVNEATEYEVIDKDGNVHNIEVHSTPYYEGKKIIGFQGIARDITEKKLAAGKLSQERILLRTLIDNLPDNIYVKDIKRRKVLVNKADLAVIGKPEEEVIGKDDSELFPEDVAASFMADDRLVLEKGQPILNREEKVINYQNKSLWLLTSKLPLYDHEGRITGLIGIGHNITERKEADELLKEREQKLKEKNEEYQHLNKEYKIVNQELTDSIERMQKMNDELRLAKEKAEESDRLKTTFLANMSHEIRTPMNGILGFTQILQQIDIDDSRRIHYLDIINKSCDRLLSVVNDIIDISKIESGIIELQYDDANIDEILNELYDFYYESCSSKNITLKINKQLSSNKIHCSTDAIKLEQILSNLVNNAIKFTNSGGISIFSYIKNNMLEFAIKDTGIGIEEKDLKIVFDRFRQVDDKSTRNYGGTGLGLVIAKAYVNKLGGKIWLESTKGKGTAVYFNIPFVPATVTQKSQQNDNEIEEYNWSGKKILIAEDEISNYEYIAEVLDYTKATIYHAKNGEEAISIFENNNLDLILMDIKMPKMDGILATKKIRKKNKKIPIIALTAYAMKVNKKETREAVFDDHIIKPAYVNTILSMLDKYLK